MSDHENELPVGTDDRVVGSIGDAEAERFAALIERRRQGEMDEDDFRRFRVHNGIYGIRGQTDVHMVRVKIPCGVLTASQLTCLADLTERFARGVAHLTTRQDVEFHWVPLAAVPEVMRRLGRAGLTTREAGGSVVRNITACPLAGVCAREVLDVTPYAAGLSRFLLRNPIGLALPRKFKIAFSGCADDCAATGIHDLGALAVAQEGDGAPARGFRLHLGGGLGATPRAAQLLEPFTPAEDLILTAVAVLRVFDRLGNRQNRARARLKFLVEELGFEKFRQLVLDERRIVWTGWPGPTTALGSDESHPPPQREASPSAAPTLAGFDEWRRTNVIRQKQAGFSAAFVIVPGGDLTAAQFRSLESLLERWPGTELRVTLTQDVVLRWVQDAWLPGVHTALSEATLARPGATGIANVVSCPGAEVCNLAVTHSHRLALETSRQLSERLGKALAEDLRGVSIRISGCPNACGLHHIGTIGLYGTARRIEGRQVPFYQLMLGGAVRDGQVTFGEPVLRLPARRVPEAIVRLVERYRAERAEGESFRDWARRLEDADGG